jgi:hypothetical protein
MLQNLFRSYFARFMYPLAQAFVLSKILRGVLLCIPFWIYDIGLTWYVRNNAFFWDTVQLASKHGLFYYENDFSSLLLPDAIDSGHPPFFGMYIALCWKIFGKTLIVSHLSILPFLMGITWQALKFGEKILGEWQTFLFILLLKINPIMAGQSTLVSPDIPLAFFFLLALNSIFNQNNFKNNVLLSISILGLSMISMRGMMVAAALFIFQGYLLYFKNTHLKKKLGYFKITIHLIIPYLLGGICALSFLSFHYIKKGWIGYFPDSEWADAFQIVNFKGFIKNIIVLTWRLVDAGHLILWFIIFFLGFHFYKIQKTQLDIYKFRTTQTLVALLIIFTVVLSPTLLIYKGLLQSRYLLPIYLIVNALCLKMISDLKAGTLQNTFFSISIVALLSGHYWIYPQPIATSWETTLAHIPYYRLRNDMIDFIKKEKIPFDKIGTAFPNASSFKFIDLSNSTESFAPLDFNKNQYIFYSNVMNDFNKKELNELKNHWKMVRILRGGQVEISLYEKL